MNHKKPKSIYVTKRLMTSFKLSVVQKNARIWDSDFEKIQKLGNFPLPKQLQIFRGFCDGF